MLKLSNYLFFISLIGLPSISPFSYGLESTSQSNKVAAPQTTYRLLYSLNADQAFIFQKRSHRYQLVLTGVQCAINYKFAHDEHESGTVDFKEFLNRWREEYRLSTVNVTITGVQNHAKTLGSTQYYLNTRVSNPYYDSKKRTARFYIVPLRKMNVMHAEKIVNVTVFINGCDLHYCK